MVGARSFVRSYSHDFEGETGRLGRNASGGRTLSPTPAGAFHGAT